MKIRMKSAIGFAITDAVDDAPGETTLVLAAAPITGSTGSPLEVAAAAAGVTAFFPISRRLIAAAAHINGAAAGAWPSPPACNHDSRPRLIPSTEPEADAGRGDAVITGASATTGTATASTATDTGSVSSVGTAGDESAADTPGSGTTAADTDGLGATWLSGAVLGTPVGVGAVSVDRSRTEGISTSSAVSATPAPRRPPRTVSAELPSVVAAEPVPGRAGDPPFEGSSAGATTEDPPRRPVRVLTRLSVRDDAESLAAEEPDPVDPPDPVVSANATGTDAIAEPTPNATANAPTRPTHRA